MNQLAQCAVIASVSYGLRIGRRGAATHLALGQIRRRVDQERRGQTFTANATQLPTQGRDRRKAILTNRQPGNIGQRQKTDTAIGGEKNGKEALRDRAPSRAKRQKRARDRAGLGRDTVGASLAFATAEDEPPKFSLLSGPAERLV